MKVLFVATRKNCKPEDRELYEMEFMNELLGFRRSLFDLGLLTVAACTPEDIEVEVSDEYVEPIPWNTDADLIALSAKTSAVMHAYEVADEFRKRGKKVVLGGIHASLRPNEALDHVDYVVVGEAEKTWPGFLRMFQAGKAPKITNSQGFPPMDDIPIPRWDRIDASQFLFHQMQTTRGCPFMCRFCSVPDISGSSFRFKPVEKVVEEIRALPNSGFIKNKMKSLYIVDDNFISRVRYTKDLLKALVPLYRAKELKDWSAETTLNVAHDLELLDLFAEAGCSTLIIGFESINEATLIEMKKTVNFSVTYQEAIHRIHDRGMSIVGNFIVGFDTDTLSVFNDIIHFVNENQIIYPFFSILTPMPGTKLHEDFKSTGRIDHFDWAEYDTRHVVFEPKNMTREQLMDGYIWLFEEAYTSDASYRRLERYWKTYRKGKRKSSAVENLFIRMKMRKFIGGASDRFRRAVQAGWRSLSADGARSDIGQLVYYFDSANFVDYLDKFCSKNYLENVRIFRGEDEMQTIQSQHLNRKQWERERRVNPN